MNECNNYLNLFSLNQLKVILLSISKHGANTIYGGNMFKKLARIKRNVEQLCVQVFDE